MISADRSCPPEQAAGGCLANTGDSTHRKAVRCVLRPPPFSTPSRRYFQTSYGQQSRRICSRHPLRICRPGTCIQYSTDLPAPNCGFLPKSASFCRHSKGTAIPWRSSPGAGASAVNTQNIRLTSTVVVLSGVATQARLGQRFDLRWGYNGSCATMCKVTCSIP